MSVAMGAMNQDIIDLATLIAEIKWQLSKVNRPKDRANKMGIRTEDKDVGEEELPKLMDKGVVEELTQPMHNQPWQEKKMKEQPYMRRLTTVGPKTNMQ